MSTPWGDAKGDYIQRELTSCSTCKYQCEYNMDICYLDLWTKIKIKAGRDREAIELIRELPSSYLRQYLDDKCRTPTDIIAVILDELGARSALCEVETSRI